MTIQLTPNLSASMPKLDAKKVFVSGICTCPPVDSASKNRFASASLLAVIDKRNSRRNSPYRYSYRRWP